MDAKIYLDKLDAKETTILDPIKPNIILAGNGGGGEDLFSFPFFFKWSKPFLIYEYNLDKENTNETKYPYSVLFYKADGFNIILSVNTNTNSTSSLEIVASATVGYYLYANWNDDIDPLTLIFDGKLHSNINISFCGYSNSSNLYRQYYFINNNGIWSKYRHSGSGSRSYNAAQLNSDCYILYDDFTLNNRILKMFYKRYYEILEEDGVKVIHIYIPEELKIKFFDIVKVNNLSIDNTYWVGIYNFSSGARVIINKNAPIVAANGSNIDITGANTVYINGSKNQLPIAAGWYGVDSLYVSVSGTSNSGVYGATQEDLDTSFILSTQDIYFNGKLIVKKTIDIEDLI